MNQKTIDLEQRLIKFAVRVISIAESLPGTKAGNHLASQLVRSGTSPALNYGEAQDAESKTDFIHRLKIVTKELRETRVSLQIIELMGSPNLTDDLRESSDECNQLISIFVKSIRTSRNTGQGPRTS
jgi:four helix bundle protein